MEDLVCPVCGKKQVEDANFCYSCGEPLTQLAKDLVQTQKNNIKLEVLSKVIDVIDDKNVLIKIKVMADKLKN